MRCGKSSESHEPLRNQYNNVLEPQIYIFHEMICAWHQLDKMEEGRDGRKCLALTDDNYNAVIFGWICIAQLRTTAPTNNTFHGTPIVHDGYYAIKDRRKSFIVFQSVLKAVMFNDIKLKSKLQRNGKIMRYISKQLQWSYDYHTTV